MERLDQASRLIEQDSERIRNNASSFRNGKNSGLFRWGSAEFTERLRFQEFVSRLNVSRPDY